ncbi:hypothetical protein FGO68_gene15101 [Halteria grandinella]|uniref:Translation initiation factor 5A-like N-terminal domain-containing protein n=1 Tax=Halteria grandinella TaxID=5974 RepID=A0A8J8SWR8_HALGN|nr:hypothetical protein FGO68_gene15101 [Halteria grandinella]
MLVRIIDLPNLEITLSSDPNPLTGKALAKTYNFSDFQGIDSDEENIPYSQLIAGMILHDFESTYNEKTLQRSQSDALKAQILQLSLDFQLQCQFTSFIAVHKNKDKPDVELRSQVINFPVGMASQRGQKEIVMMIDGVECRVLQQSVAKTGKHGSAKKFVTYIDPVSGQKKNKILAADQHTDIKQGAGSAIPIIQENKADFESLLLAQSSTEGSWPGDIALIQHFFSDPSHAKFDHERNQEIQKEILSLLKNPDDMGKVWVTIIAMAVLKLRFKDKEGEWVLIAEKGMQYLRGSLGNGKAAQQLVKKVIQLL